MQEFLNDLTTARFWLGIITVGLVLNVASTYVTRLLDRAASLVSSRRKVASEEQRLRLEATVAHLMANREEQFETRMEYTYYMVRGATNYVLAAACMVVSILASDATLAKAFTFVGVALLALGFSWTRRSDQLRDVIAEVVKTRETTSSTTAGVAEKGRY
jgi:hypothetical protein